MECITLIEHKEISLIKSLSENLRYGVTSSVEQGPSRLWYCGPCSSFQWHFLYGGALISFPFSLYVCVCVSGFH